MQRRDGQRVSRGAVPFEISIPAGRLENPRSRLADTRWPTDTDGAAFPCGHPLTNATIWWTTQTITSSIRVYSNTLR